LCGGAFGEPGGKGGGEAVEAAGVVENEQHGLGKFRFERFVNDVGEDCEDIVDRG
jgi:hypothetical protein